MLILQKYYGQKQRYSSGLITEQAEKRGFVCSLIYKMMHLPTDTANSPKYDNLKGSAPL